MYQYNLQINDIKNCNTNTEDAFRFWFFYSMSA